MVGSAMGYSPSARFLRVRDSQMRRGPARPYAIGQLSTTSSYSRECEEACVGRRMSLTSVARRNKPARNPHTCTPASPRPASAWRSHVAHHLSRTYPRLFGTPVGPRAFPLLRAYECAEANVAQPSVPHKGINTHCLPSACEHKASSQANRGRDGGKVFSQQLTRA